MAANTNYGLVVVSLSFLRCFSTTDLLTCAAFFAIAAHVYSSSYLNLYPFFILGIQGEFQYKSFSF